MRVGNVSTQKEKTRKDARVPRSPEDAWRPESACAASSKGTDTPCALNAQPPMLPRVRRLPAVRFRELRGKVVYPELTLRYGPNALGKSRHAVVIGIKVDKRSSHRHRIKRSILEAVRHLQGGIDCVWIVAPAAKTVSSHNLQALVEEVWMRRAR